LRGEVQAGRREGVGWRRASGMHGKARLKAWRSQGMRGAHPEHTPHVRDLGGVEAQRLVERRRVLPRVKGRGMCDAGRDARLEAGGRGAAAAEAVCRGKGPTQGLGATARAERT